MKKKFGIFLAIALIFVCIFAITAFAEETTETTETITISYIKDSNTIYNTTTLDTTAYSGGKQTVEKGEKFTLPTTSNTTNATVEGYQLVWYTRDGRTYKAGEEVSFEEDTSLYRVAAKECYTASELGVALTNGTYAGILMADMETTSAVSFPSWSTGIIIMNGFNLNFVSNSSGLIGEQRTQRHFYGEGTINVTNPDGKVGAHYFLKATNHGYAGENSRTVIGRDVTINAPNHYLTGDESSDIVNRYVWTKIYGTINCYGLFYRPASNNCGAFTEFFDTCNVTFTGEHLIWDANNNGKFNYLGTDIAIYGGTFYLPAAAANESFWTNDNLETLENYDGSKTYTNVGLTQLNKDNIKIYGGSFVTADGSMPAIANYVANTYTGAWKTGGNGLVTNNNTSTYEVPYKARPGIKLVFTTYSDSALGTITVTDYVGSALSGKTFKYTMKTLEDGSYEIIVYESRIETTTAEDGTVTETEVWDVISDELAIKWGNGGTILVSYDLTSENLELYGFEANNAVYQTVIPADCEHNFTGAPVEATCEEKAYADYNCSVCAHNVYFSWGEKAPHAYEATSSIAPTATTLGSSSFVCSMCNDAKTYATTLDPREFEVVVTIKNDDGTLENVTVMASDLFEFSTIGGNGAYMYTLSAIKAFGDYSIRNINGVVIPNGIMYVNITTQNLESYNDENHGLEILEIAENSIITLQNIGNLSCLTTIKVGKNVNIVIESNASKYNPNGENRTTSKLNTIDFSAGNITAKVMSSAFQDRPITSLLLGKDSSYEFQYQSFKNIQITELVIPTPCSFNFGSNVFQDADITSLTFPDGTAENINTWSLGDYCFYNCPITSVKFGQYGKYTFGGNSFAKLQLTGTLTFAPNSTYTINGWAFSSNQFTVIDASAGNITLNVNGSGLRNLTNVTEFKFGENSTYVFNGESIGTTTYTKFTLAPNSSYTFNNNFLKDNTTFTEIDASAENITINFNANCFNGRTAFSTLTLGKGANLTFSEDCFKSTALTGLELPENATILFNANGLRNFTITELEIKEGSTVTFANNALKESTIEALTLAGNSSYTLNGGCFNYTTTFTELIFKENTTCVFKDWALNSGSTLTKIDLSADNIDVTFNSHALRNAKALTELAINGKNGTYIFNSESVRDVSGITELILGEGSTYEFKQNSFYGTNNITRIDASASNITATFGRGVFSDKTNLTSFTIGENSTYVFDYRAFYNTAPANEIVFSNTSTFDIGYQAFSGTDFASVKFEDNVGETQYVTFTGSEAFYNCTAKELYIGKNIAITNYPFKNFKYLEKLVIMDGVTHASTWEFDNAGSADFTTPLVVYNHSYDLTFTEAMFNNCDGIVLYTVTDNIGTRTDVFKNCADVTTDTGTIPAWTVILGLPHALVKGQADPTCTEVGGEIWIGDGCSCGLVITEEIIVNVYESKHNITDSTEVARQDTYSVDIIPANGHTRGELITIVYDNGFLQVGYKHYDCTVCEEDDVDTENPQGPIFKDLGYSYSETSYAISHSFAIDHTVLNEYNVYANDNVKLGTYGLVAANATLVTNGTPFTQVGTTTNGAVFVDYSNRTKYDIIEMRVNGLKKADSDHTDVDLYCTAYYTIGDTIYYFENGEEKTILSSPVSFNDLKEANESTENNVESNDQA